MSETLNNLSYPWGDTVPPTGTVQAVMPGVYWVRMPLPFALNHINLWLLRDELEGRSGWTIIDCGITSDVTRAAWEQIFDQELEGLPVLRVLATHMHPDHVGLAHWLVQRWSTPANECRLWMSATDYFSANLASRSTTGVGGESAARFMLRHGLQNEEQLQMIRERSHYYASMVPELPSCYRRIQDGDVIRMGGVTWRCIAGYGHAPEHQSLYCEEQQVLISGDMVLPNISTNVSVLDFEPEGDPLRLYLESLKRIIHLPEKTLVLPSHGRPFYGLHARIAQLHQHHAERLERVEQACQQRSQGAADLLPILFNRPLDLHQTTFAMGEAIAHLNYLWHQGRLRRRLSEDGGLRFVTAYE
jgi:glyoxylase-like metal-dependent hydrolase (beta-lactamase superfamily II)